MWARAPLVSFFVQAHNTEPWVGECLSSVLGQEGSYAFDVLVIDDASTDGTAGVAARFTDSRVRVVRHERNGGAIATANEGYGAVTGEYVVRLDSDDRLRPDFLVKTVPRLEEDPNCGLVYGDIATIDERGRVTREGGFVQRQGRPPGANELLPLLRDNFIPAPATIVRRAALLPLLPIPLDLRFLDWYLTTGIAERWDSYYVDDVIAEYRVHPASMHRAMIVDRTGETTSRRVLDTLFANDVRRTEKRRSRRSIYGRHYLTYADKYFGCRMYRDARRCYVQAILRQPQLILDPGVVRRLGATLVGPRIYESAKAVLSRRPAS